MSGKRVGYIRVSTVDQNPARQLEGIDLDKKFVEYASGSTTERPELIKMLDYVRDDDVVMVHSMDRMARNVRDLWALVDELVGKNVEVRFVKENLVFNGKNDAISRLTLSIMGSVAEFELARNHERLMEGVRIAQAAGKYTGRKRVMTDEQVEQARHMYSTTRLSLSKIAAEFGVCAQTILNYLKKSDEKDHGSEKEKQTFVA